MNKEEIDIELIEKYLDRELSEVEQSDFEAKLQSDRGFQDKCLPRSVERTGLA